MRNTPWLLSKEETRRRSGRFQRAGAKPGEGRRPPRTPSLNQIDGHRLRLGIVLHHFLAHLAAPAGLLEAAERPGGVAIIVGVDADRARLDLARKRMGDLQVTGPDARLQSVFGVVG